MSDLLRNSTEAERAQSAAGQQNAACIHSRIKANCMECSAPEMLELLWEMMAPADKMPPWLDWRIRVSQLLARFPR